MQRIAWLFILISIFGAGQCLHASQPQRELITTVINEAAQQLGGEYEEVLGWNPWDSGVRYSYWDIDYGGSKCIDFTVAVFPSAEEAKQWFESTYTTDYYEVTQFNAKPARYRFDLSTDETYGQSDLIWLVDRHILISAYYGHKEIAKSRTYDQAGVLHQAAEDNNLFAPLETTMMVYPSEYLNKNTIVFRTTNSSTFGTDLYFTVDADGGKASIEGAESSGIYWTTINGEGEALAELVYGYTSMEDMQAHPNIKVIAATAQGAVSAEYVINVKQNWEDLKAEYLEFQGAAANPCLSWIDQIAWVNYHNGFLLNVGDYAGVNPPGHGDFVCGMYSKRIFLWLMGKRFHTDKSVAAKMNGLVPMVYKTVNIPVFVDGAHLMAGISAAGSEDAAKDGGGGIQFLDPWWKQMGPEILTAEDEADRLRSCVLRITLPGAALAYYSGPTGWYFFVTRIGLAVEFALLLQADTELTTGWHLEGPTDKIGKIVGNIPGTGKYNLAPFEALQPDLSSYITLKMPQCSHYTLPDDLAENVAFESTEYAPGMAEEIKCPVAFTLSDDSGHSFTADLTTNTFSGDFPFTGFIYPSEDGTSQARLGIYQDDLSLTLKGLADSVFTLESFAVAENQQAVYRDVAINVGEIFELSVTGGNVWQPLIGPDNIQIMPEGEDDTPPDDQGEGTWITDESGTWTSVDGGWRMDGAGTERNNYVYYDRKLFDFDFSATIKQPEGDARYPAGLLFRCPGSDIWDNHYFFLITTEGQYAMGKVSNGKRHYFPFAKWRTSKKIITGSDAENTIRIKSQATQFKVWINGSIIFTDMNDETFAWGYPGLTASDGSDTDVYGKVIFSDISIENLGGVMTDRDVQASLWFERCSQLSDGDENCSSTGGFLPGDRFHMNITANPIRHENSSYDLYFLMELDLHDQAPLFWFIKPDLTFIPYTGGSIGSHLAFDTGLPNRSKTIELFNFIVPDYQCSSMDLIFYGLFSRSGDIIQMSSNLSSEKILFKNPCM